MTTVVSKTIPVARPSFGVEEEEAVVAVLRSGWVSQGPRVAEFERRFAEYVGAAHAVAVSSCTTGLHLALLAAGVKAGDEVLCPSLSFIATANSIVYAGARPVFVDIDASTQNMDPACLEAAITPRTKAILLVHQVGMPAALEEIAAVAKRHGVALVEDAACAIGAEYRGQRIGMPHSLMACFSFHPRKVLTTGEGGMITTADERVAEWLRKARQHAMSISDLARHSAGSIIQENYPEVGYNYRMTDLQAAVGLVQLRKLEAMIDRRRMLASRYTSRLSALPWLSMPSEPAGCRSNFQSYVVRLRANAPVTRDELMDGLLKNGVSSRRGIMAIHRELPYGAAEWDSRLPVTNAVSDSSLILPLFHSMTEEEQDYVMECVERAG